MEVCQGLDLKDFPHLDIPPVTKLFRQKNLEQVCYFIYQQLEPNLNYEVWFDSLFRHTPSKYCETLYNTKLSLPELLNYISSKLHLKITILQRSLVRSVCPSVPCSLQAKHSGKCQVMSVFYTSCYSNFLKCEKSYTFILCKAGSISGLYLVKSTLDFPIITSTLPTKSLNEVEHLLAEKFSVPKFSILESFYCNPLEHVPMTVNLCVADSLFTGSTENIQCLGIIYIVIYLKLL